MSLSGTLDLAMRRVDNGQSKTFLLQRDGANSSKLVIRGNEDLGDGYGANFFLDSTVKADTGSSATPFFDRRSTVSLTTPYGEIRLGRDAALQNSTPGDFDALNGKGVGNVMNLATPFNFSATNTFTRVSNAISYLTPNTLGGFYGQLQWAPSEGAGPGNKVTAFGLGYLKGPLEVRFTSGRNETNQVAVVNPLTGTSSAPLASTAFATAKANASGSWTYTSLGSSYKFDAGTLLGSVTRFGSAEALSGAGSRKEMMYNIGAMVPVAGVHSVNFAYTWARRSGLGSEHQGASQLALQYMHNFSKRTAVYVSAARLAQDPLAVAENSRYNADGTDLVTRSGVSFDLGLRHRF